MLPRISSLLLALLLGACARPEKAPEVAVPAPVAKLRLLQLRPPAKTEEAGRLRRARSMQK